MALAEPVSVTVGPTLAIATVTVSLSDALSESLTVTLTVEAGRAVGERADEAAGAAGAVEVGQADLGPVEAAVGGVEDERVGARVARGEAVREAGCPRWHWPSR